MSISVTSYHGISSNGVRSFLHGYLNLPPRILHADLLVLSPALTMPKTSGWFFVYLSSIVMYHIYYSCISNTLTHVIKYWLTLNKPFKTKNKGFTCISVLHIDAQSAKNKQIKNLFIVTRPNQPWWLGFRFLFCTDSRVILFVGKGMDVQQNMH